jgi:hypothetical protein
MQTQDIKKQQLLAILEKNPREIQECSGLIEIDQFHKIIRRNGL